MINIPFNNFKLIPKKRVVSKNVNVNKRLTKLINGICFKEGNEYKIKVDVKDIEFNCSDILDFTEESYELKGILSVFSRDPDKSGRYTRYIRNESDAKFMPGNSDKYVPFCPNWVCNGYIVRNNFKLMFEFNECMYPKGYESITK